jgi:hypothetical protein
MNVVNLGVISTHAIIASVWIALTLPLILLGWLVVCIRNREQASRRRVLIPVEVRPARRSTTTLESCRRQIEPPTRAPPTNACSDSCETSWLRRE